MRESGVAASESTREQISGDRPLSGAERRAYYRLGASEIRSQTARPNRAVSRLPAAAFLDQLGPALRAGMSPLRAYADAALARSILTDCPKHACVLDLGCGRGHYAHFYERLGHSGTYVGVDITPRPEWRALVARVDGPVRVQLIAAPAERADLGRERFDFSMSHNAIEHIEDPVTAIANVFAAMKPGARGLHSVPAPWALLLYGPHGFRRYTADALAGLFENAGFEVEELIALGGGASFAFHLAWITWLETGAIYDVATWGALPRAVREGLSRIGRNPFARRAGPARNVYAWLGRLALLADSGGPTHGYAVRIRKPMTARTTRSRRD